MSPPPRVRVEVPPAAIPADDRTERRERGGVHPRAERILSLGLLGLVNLVGVAAFTYPFLLPEPPDGGAASAHATTAPLLFGLLSILVLAIAVAEIRRGAMDARHIALLGILAGLNAVLRLPGSFAGASLMFFLPMVSGLAFGARFGFLLGGSSMAASAVLTGGVGPWLPFQMWALGWFGAGGALVRPLARRGRRAAVAGLAVYGWVGGLAFGALMNLWFWPFLAGGPGAISWEPGLGAAEGLGRYWSFFLITSLGWDAARGFATAAMAIVFAPAVLPLLERFRRRMDCSSDHS